MIIYRIYDINTYMHYKGKMMSSAIQFNKISKITNPKKYINGMDISELDCEWMEADSAPSHIKKMGILRTVKRSCIDFFDAVTKIHGDLKTRSFSYEPYLNGYTFYAEDGAPVSVKEEELNPYRYWEEYKAYLFEREYIGHIYTYMFPLRMRRNHGTVNFERMMKIAKKYIFDSGTILYRDNEILELIMKVAFISQESDCIVEYYID